LAKYYKKRPKKIIRFYGFAVRDRLLLKNLDLKPGLSVLEIGVGSGSTIRRLRGKVAEVWAVDISEQAIDQLRELYGDSTDAVFLTVDVQEEVNLMKKFDRIYSADTLEHVPSAAGFFRFVARHLKNDGEALVIFPNETEKRAHGVTRFRSREEFEAVIEGAGLCVDGLKEVQKTIVHRLLKAFLWQLPEYLLRALSRKKAKDKQVNGVNRYDSTLSCRLNEREGWLKSAAALYASVVTAFASLFPLYRQRPARREIAGKYLLLSLKKIRP